MGTDGRYVVEGYIEGVDAFVPGRVAAFAFSHSIDYQQAPFARCCFQACGFAYDYHFGVERTFRTIEPAGTVLSASFFFATQGKNQVEGQFTAQEVPVGGYHCHHAAPVVIGTQTVDDVLVVVGTGRVEGVAGPALAYWNSVYMGIQDQCFFVRVHFLHPGYQVVAQSFVHNTPGRQTAADQVSYCCFLKRN